MIPDKQGALNTNQIRNYLQSRKWKLTSKLPNMEIFELQHDGKVYEVHLPTDETSPDFPRSIGLLITDLCFAEKRTARSVISDMLQPKKDTMSIAIRSTDTQSGTIAFDDAIAVLENVRRALAAVAYSIDNPQPAFVHPYNRDVEKFLRDCRLGQTETGSFVINIECPTENTVQLELGDKKLEEFGRRTTKKFMESIAYLNSITERSLTITPSLPSDYKTHVNANLCTAIANLEPDLEDFHIDFSMSWAQGMEVLPSQESEVTLRKYQMDAIFNIGESLQPSRPAIVKDYVGRVSVLKGEPHRKKVFGEVVLNILDEDSIVKVRIDLPRPDYVTASICHTQNKNVIVKGRLVRESPRVFRIVNYEYFRELKEK